MATKKAKDEASDQAKAIAKQIGTLKIESWRLDRIIPYDKNPRKIGPDAVAKVAGSIQRFGFNAPIGVDEDGVILYGHTRLQAAKHLGLKIAPVVVLAGLTELQKKEFRIADNRVAEESDWDKGLLSEELEALKDAGADLLGTGFDADELAKLVDGLEIEMPEEEQKVAPSSKKLPAATEAPVERKPVSVDSNQPRSVLDGLDYPQLCRWILRSYTPAGGVVISPFAGLEGAGAIAAELGLELHDLPIDQLPRPVVADLVFGVPAPPNGEFVAWSEHYAQVLDKAAERLKPGRFMAIFIGEARTPTGACYGLPLLTMEYGLRAGLQLHDTAVIVLPEQGDPASWVARRELMSAHAYVLIFVKGNPALAAQAIIGA